MICQSRESRKRGVLVRACVIDIVSMSQLLYAEGIASRTWAAMTFSVVEP
jgi:hypothetical protein